MEQYDVIVIGAGPGGYPAAIRSAQLGARTAIVEREWLGGTCLNCGCIPTKAIIASSVLYQDIQRAETFGLHVDNASVDYSKIAERKDKVVGTLVKGVDSLLKANGVDQFEGVGCFTGSNSVRVTASDGTESELKADKIIIATGSEAARSGFIPRHERILDSREFLDLTELPESLLVLGGGYIGCEMAEMVAALGVKVTVVELLDDVLTILDKDARLVVKRHMKKQLGIEILTGSPMEDIQAGDNAVKARAGDRELEADMMLIAVGREPRTEGLKLEKAGLETDENGYIPVDQYSRTRNSSIFAVGDVTDRDQLAHAATSQGVYAAEAALGNDLKPAERLIPGVIFTLPEVGVVGLTEAEAKEEGMEVETGKFSFRALGKALVAEESDGFAKWVADPDTKQLLGAEAVGPHATDIIAEATLAIRNELTADEVGNTVHGHPTMSESWMEAAHVLHNSCIHAPPKGKNRK